MNKGAAKLKKITTAAKKLYKSGKYAKWTDAVKAASKQIGKTKAVGKWSKGNTVMIEQWDKPVKRKKNVKVKRLSPGSKSGKPGTFKKFTSVSVSGLANQIEKVLTNKLATLEVKKIKAKTKKEKNAIAKEKRAVVSKIRKIKLI